MNSIAFYADMQTFMESFNFDTLKFEFSKSSSNPTFMDVIHMHNYFEMIFCTDGKTSINYDSGSLNPRVYDLIIIPPGTCHQGYSDIQFKDEVILVWFNIECDISKKTIIKLADKSGTLSWLITQINEEYTKKGDDYEKIIFNHLFSIMLIIMRLVRNNRHDKIDTIDYAIQYIYENPTQILSIKKLAQMVNMSPAYFSRLFKRKVGMSPLHFINNVKIEKAKRLLTNHNKNINEVSFELGYKDQFYFSRIFKKITGSSPCDYKSSYNRLS